MIAALTLSGVSKHFDGVKALDQVSLDLQAGEIRALMGENGAGKSTLLKILAGQYRPDAGCVVINGRTVDLRSPQDATAHGIAIIHQELHLVPDLSVAENLTLGVMPAHAGLLDRRAMKRKAEAILARLGETIDLDARLGSLPIGKRQMIEIGKALLRDANVIAFDEPTSSLSARETKVLLEVIRELKAEGRAILYVSHRLEEVFGLCDSLTVLRDGGLVGHHARLADVSEGQLIAEMAGRQISSVYDYKARPLGDVTLAVDGLLGPGLKAPVSFSVRRGEILGFFGLVGAGRSELLKLIYGAMPASAGRVTLHGGAVLFSTPRAAIAAGLGLLPEDRKGEGIVPLASVSENVAIAKRNLQVRPLIDKRREADQSKHQVEELRVRTASLETPIASLSGGNQQKVVLARWLAAGSDILLMDEPTRGIDVGARSEIYALMHRLAASGKTLIVVSSDMPEIMGLSDRVVVMREGTISVVLDRDELSPERLLKHALPEAGRSAAAS